MEYQGFTGSNYEEDDRERAKHGGSIGGFGRNTLPPGYKEAINPLVSARIAQPTQPSIDTKEESEPEEYKQLDDIRSRIMMRQRVLDSMLQDAAEKDPRYAQDMENNTRTYYNDFLKQYPDYEKMDREQAEDEDMYNLDPMAEEHLKRRLEQDKKMLDMPPRAPSRFKKIDNSMK